MVLVVFRLTSGGRQYSRVTVMILPHTLDRNSVVAGTLVGLSGFQMKSTWEGHVKLLNEVSFSQVVLDLPKQWENYGKHVKKCSF